MAKTQNRKQRWFENEPLRVVEYAARRNFHSRWQKLFRIAGEAPTPSAVAINRHVHPRSKRATLKGAA